LNYRTNGRSRGLRRGVLLTFCGERYSDALPAFRLALGLRRKATIRLRARRLPKRLRNGCRRFLRSVAGERLALLLLTRIPVSSVVFYSTMYLPAFLHSNIGSGQTYYFMQKEEKEEREGGAGDILFSSPTRLTLFSPRACGGRLHCSTVFVLRRGSACAWYTASTLSLCLSAGCCAASMFAHIFTYLFGKTAYTPCLRCLCLSSAYFCLHLFIHLLLCCLLSFPLCIFTV